MALLRKLEFRKAGLSGLFLLALTTLAFAEPLKIEVEEASALRDQASGEPIVVIRMKDVSRQAFSNLTSRHIGKQVDVRVDGKVVMTPVIREPIAGGFIAIFSKFTLREADDMARKIKAGAVVEVEPIEALR